MTYSLVFKKKKKRVGGGGGGLSSMNNVHFIMFKKKTD